MGTWGAGLYEDDYAADLRNAIALIAKIPADGDRLLEILLAQEAGNIAIGDENKTMFWLIVADQFERRGIFSAEAFRQARSVIDSNMDLEQLNMRGAGERFIVKRKKVLGELLERLNAPRPLRKLPAAPKPPRLAVSPGQIYAFPTMGFQPCNAWFPTWEREGFKPNGWGAFLVVSTGRAFDWLPWCALTSLAIPKDRPPSFEEAIHSATLINGRYGAPAVRCIPMQSHLKRMQAQLIGTLELDADKAGKIVSTYPTVEAAIQTGWSICSIVFGFSPAKPLGPMLSEISA